MWQQQTTITTAATSTNRKNPTFSYIYIDYTTSYIVRCTTLLYSTLLLRRRRRVMATASTGELTTLMQLQYNTLEAPTKRSLTLVYGQRKL